MPHICLGCSSFPFAFSFTAHSGSEVLKSYHARPSAAYLCFSLNSLKPRLCYLSLYCPTVHSHCSQCSQLCFTVPPKSKRANSFIFSSCFFHTQFPIFINCVHLTFAPLCCRSLQKPRTCRFYCVQLIKNCKLSRGMHSGDSQ